jgi:hypothetical protein
MMRRQLLATFVLVHGSYFGSWSWRWVTPHLRTAGHDVYVPRQEDERVRSEPSWRYRELEGSHAAPITVPQAVAALLVELAE